MLHFSVDPKQIQNNPRPDNKDDGQYDEHLVFRHEFKHSGLVRKAVVLKPADAKPEIVEPDIKEIEANQ